MGGATPPHADALPEGLKDLAYRNAALARPDPDFKADMGRLIEGLEAIVGVAKDKSAKASEESAVVSSTLELDS